MKEAIFNANLKFHDEEDFIVIDKPEGLTTHRSNDSDLGIQEFYQQQLGRQLFVVHRLDKETSGVLIFTKSTSAAEKLSLLFKNRQIQKEYFFLTDKPATFQKKSHSSYIEKKGEVKKQNSDTNSTTHFEFIKNLGPYFLWKAEPITGKPHQIRRHAKDLGIPLLGDTLYGGSPWHRLALNAQKISFDWNNQKRSYESRSPWWSQVTAHLKKELITTEAKQIFECYHTALEKRLRCYSELPPSFRLMNDEHPDLTWDKYDDQEWISWYNENPPSLQIQNLISDLLRERNQKGYIRWMKNRGADPNSNSLWPLHNPNDIWISNENSTRFEIRSNTGLSPGLFLDQRRNRKWVLENSKDKEVLNLFSYTCGFSVCAALGQAKAVVSNDVSTQFLDWGKKNFELNQLDPKKYEFFKQDVFLFLKGTQKRQRLFDLIIADPPSFGRSDRGVFQFKKDWSPLLDHILSILKPNGQILFSCNYEGWDTEEFHKSIQQWSIKNKCSLKPLPLPDLDYEFSTVHRKMKCLLIQKKN